MGSRRADAYASAAPDDVSAPEVSESAASDPADDAEEAASARVSVDANPTGTRRSYLRGLPSPSGMMQSMKSSLGGFGGATSPPALAKARSSSGLRASTYEPPDRAKALAYMRSFRPLDTESAPDADGNPRRYSLFVGDDDMARIFGDGISFWFVLLRNYVATSLLVVLLLSHFWNMARVANEENETSTSDLSLMARASLAAMLLWGRAKSKSGAVDDADRDAALGVVVSDAVVMVLISIGTVYMYRLKRRKERENDQRMITLDDYTVEVHGLPEDVDEAAVRAHFERHGELHDVTFGRDLHELIALRRKLFDLEGKHDVLEFMLQRARKILGEDEPDAGGGAAKEADGGGHGDGGGASSSDAKSLWSRSTKAVLAAAARGASFMWTAALDAAKDKTKSMKERSEAAAKAARYKAFGENKNVVGAMMALKPQDFDTDALADRLAENRREREETMAEIETCRENGYRIVTAFVTYAEEKGAFDCLEAHNDAVAAEYERKRRGDADWRTMPPEDARNFGNAQRRLHVTHTAPPSDVLWENMHWSRATMWRRRLGTAIAMLAFIILETALISRSKVAVRNVLNPEPDCGSVGAGGATLDCPAIWDLDASTRANNRARRDIMHFVREDVSASDCADFVVNGAFLRDMSDYSGFADGASVAYPSADAVAAFRDAQDRSSAYLGGFLPDSLADECAAHLCYSCYCESKGNAAWRNDEDGVGAMCGEYWRQRLARDTFLVSAAIVSALMNILIKVLAKLFSHLERPHSFTTYEASISWKITVAITINVVILPLCVAADVNSLRRVPYLFQGDYADLTAEWYEDVGNEFSQLALINSIMFPISCANEVVKWRAARHFREKLVNTQRQLDELYHPPPFSLSERNGYFAAAVLYTLIFSAGIPLGYAFMAVMCVGFYCIDRVMLLCLCAKPPRYTGKLVSILIHTLPFAVCLHFTLAVYAYGERDFPSYVLEDGVSGKWTGGGTVYDEDEQGSIAERIKRVNGLVPFVGLCATASIWLVGFLALAFARRARRRRGEGFDAEGLEGAPPVREAIERGLVRGLLSYHITAHPEYTHLFPPGAEVSKGL